MILLGITGGIGSGKSYISRLLTKHFGIPVYDCDSQAKRLNDEDPTIRQQLIALVGPHVYDPSGHLQKEALANYLFADAQHAARVNAIIHPAVMADLRNWASQQQSRVVAVESAILYESGFNNAVDYVLFVDAPSEIRLRRAMQRDSAQRPQIEARMAQQHTCENLSRADFVIENDGAANDQQLVCQLAQIINKVNI